LLYSNNDNAISALAPWYPLNHLDAASILLCTQNFNWKYFCWSFATFLWL